MEKRKKKSLDYIKWKTIKDKGDKPDKKITEASELFTALNDTLKDDLPKLFALTGNLVTGCLNNFVQLQLQWNKVWRRKLSQVIDNATIPDNVEEYINSFRGDFEIVESQVLTLGISNGSVLADAVNFLGPIGGLDGSSSPRRSSTNNADLRIRGYSQSNGGASPMLPQPDFGDQVGLPSFGNSPSHQAGTGRRIRASSSASGTGRSPKTPEIPGGWRNYSTATTPTNAHSNRPSTSTGRSIEAPSLPRLSVDTPGFNRLSGDSHANRASSNSTYFTGRSDTHTHRTSGIFSSAMPMSDSPRSQSPIDASIANKQFYTVLFLAASVYEFNIDRARQEGGYPYLTYVAGEVKSDPQTLLQDQRTCTDCILTRSSMSLAKRVSSGLPKTRTTPPTRSAGSGTSTLPNWRPTRFLVAHPGAPCGTRRVATYCVPTFHHLQLQFPLS